MVKNYRFTALILTGGFLLFAILSKLYRGPLWAFSDAYIGDAGIVACLYFGLAAVCPGLKPGGKLIVIGAVALSVELFQGTGIPGSLNLPAPFVWVLGSKFDPVDFLFYFIGLLAAFFIDKRLFYGYS
ncbi:DUF2809 domain-containing protein [candidate division KSB1 bacterium]|nr:DUF2809 domain-containing protein [candidate division KSB1 bacterium]